MIRPHRPVRDPSERPCASLHRLAGASQPMSTHRRTLIEHAVAEAHYRDLYRAWRTAHLAAAQAEERVLQAVAQGPATSEELARARALRRRADEVLLHASHAGARLMESTSTSRPRS